jgi:hypothetical protein
MTAVSALSSALVDRIATTRPAIAARSSALTRATESSDSGATRVTLGSSTGVGAVYSDPRARAGFNRLWSSPVNAGDGIAALMARNQASHSAELDRWRGLGGALLKRFAETGQAYSQTLVDEPVHSWDDGIPGMTPADQAQLATEVQTRQASELESVGTDAQTAALTIRTLSGQSVDLKISVGSGFYTTGIKVEIDSSGDMDDEVRAAVGHLAEGLDRALDGLANEGAVALNLAGLVDYDRKVLSSVDLTVAIPTKGGLLGDFSLHVGGDSNTVHLKGSDGELNLKFDNAKPLGRFGSGLQSVLDRFEAAGQRGRANAALVEQMKAAFKQLHAAAAGDEVDPRSDQPGSAAGSSTGRSGLPDFEASFGGDTWRQNRAGAHNEAGHVQYQLTQKTEGNLSAERRSSGTQTVEERISADLKKAPGDAMLYVTNGNFTATKIRDESKVTTLIAAAADGRLQVLRKTDSQQLRQVSEFANHRLVHQQAWPSHQRQVQRLT